MKALKSDLAKSMTPEELNNWKGMKQEPLLDTRSYLIGYEDGKAVKVKELTDEEILAVEKDLRYNGDFCELHFARAILSKASEK